MSYLQQSFLGIFNNQADSPRDIMQKRSFTLGLLGYVAGAFGSVFYGNILNGSTFGHFLWQMIISLVLFVPFCFFIAVVTHVFLDLFSKNGNPTGTFAIIGISEFAKILFIPLGLITAAVGGGSGLLSLGWLAVIILQFLFLLRLLGQAYEMPKGLVFVSFMFTFVITCATFFLLILAPILMIISAVI